MDMFDEESGGRTDIPGRFWRKQQLQVSKNTFPGRFWRKQLQQVSRKYISTCYLSTLRTSWIWEGEQEGKEERCVDRKVSGKLKYFNSCMLPMLHVWYSKRDLTLISVMYRSAQVYQDSIRTLSHHYKISWICPAHNMAFDTQELQLPRRPSAFRTFCRTKTRLKSQPTW